MIETNTPILEIENLHVHFSVYGGELKVLDGVNIVMYPGEKIGLVGETGCGKTTTMKAILRVLPS
ncbi:MAG: ATP-binding cassette domain-containing protein, partial [Chloroflexi bacterium]|nr:ATP-binding cassette domain-containing protein [Chloroflexota bacterium]